MVTVGLAILQRLTTSNTLYHDVQVSFPVSGVSSLSPSHSELELPQHDPGSDSDGSDSDVADPARRTSSILDGFRSGDYKLVSRNINFFYIDTPGSPWPLKRNILFLNVDTPGISLAKSEGSHQASI